MNCTKRDLALVVAGVGLGVVAGLLLAPRSGQETREELNRAANQAVERSRGYWQRVRSRSGEGGEVLDEAPEAER